MWEMRVVGTEPEEEIVDIGVLPHPGGETGEGLHVVGTGCEGVGFMAHPAVDAGGVGPWKLLFTMGLIHAREPPYQSASTATILNPCFSTSLFVMAALAR